MAIESVDGDSRTQPDDAAFRDWDPFADPADTEPVTQCGQGLQEARGTASLFDSAKAKAAAGPWDPFADPTGEDEDELEAKREAKNKAETEAFAWEVELEVEIIRRSMCEDSTEDCVRGAAMRVQFPSGKNSTARTEMFFGDAFGKTVLAVEALKAVAVQDPGAHDLAMQVVEGGMNPVLALMQGLMHLLFQPAACAHFQGFLDMFLLPGLGVLDTLSQCFPGKGALPADQTLEHVGRLCEFLKELLKTARRMVEMLAAPLSDAAKAFYWHLRTLSKVLKQDQLDAVMPDVHGEALEVQLQPAGGDCLAVWLPEEITVSALKQLLIVRLGQPSSIQLDSEPHGGSGAPQPLPLDSLVRSCSQKISVQGMVATSDSDVPTWRIQKPLLKITVESGTRMLAELRAKYQEPDFYREYHELRRSVKPGGEAVHINKALSAQSVVLPKYGFDGTLRGVMEMRNQVSLLAELDPPLMKALKDIHKLLDAHQDLPKMPIVKVIEAPRFAAEDTAAWVSHLSNEGFVVIANVVDESQVKAAYELLWDFLEEADNSGVVQRHDVNTWCGNGKDNTGWAGAADDGIIQGRGIGQSAALWYLRGLQRVKQVFADVWGTEHLVTSFDGAGVFRPYGEHRDWKISKKNWYHLDQAHFKRGLHCVQGLVTLKDATEETGGLVVVPRSHRFHNDICSHYKAGDLTSNFLSIDVNDRVLTEGDGGPRMVAARAGDMILWDSRTVHCNTSPLRENSDLLNGDDLVRAVCYICMTPAAWCSEETLRRRQQGYREGVTATHWPHEYHPKNSSRSARPAIRLTSEQMELVRPSGGCEAGACAKLGAMSFLPPRPLRVARDGVELRRSPTVEWGSPVGSLRLGEVVEGHLVGGWLRLRSWTPAPGRPRPSQDPEHELWACFEAAGGRAFEDAGPQAAAAAA